MRRIPHGRTQRLKVFRTIRELEIPKDASIGFVPTMGAFHEGHLSLMRTAKAETDFVVVSLFVNPTQFGQDEDFNRYPRDEERDMQMARSVGIDAIFIPSVEEIYSNSTTVVSVERLSARWEGKSRPGHFDGVATVVAKLFSLVGDCVAYFGMKDFQQCRIVEQMASDLFFPVRLRLLETIRESDGLAMSSRNAYLSPAHRGLAPLLHAQLRSVAEAIRRLEPGSPDIEARLHDARCHLAESGFVVDYFAYVDERTLEPLVVPRVNSRLLAAARLGTTRLIDNEPVL